MPTTPRRVAQWATGTIGLKSLRGIIEHPHLTLTGVHVFGEQKVGRDAGELCGLSPVGVTATGTLEEILAGEPDAVVYMPLFPDVDVLCTLLESGIDVVTTCGLFHHPDSMDPAVRERVEKACATGQSSIHSTGSSPGFISEALPLVLATEQRELHSLTINEYADMSQRDSAEMIFDLMGFGKPMAPFEQFRADYLCGSFGPSLRLLADSLGLPIDDVQASGELAATPHTVQIAAGTLESGTVAAQRITITGLRGDEPLITFRATWYCATELEPAWDVHDTGWHVHVDGDAPLEVAIRMPVPLERMAEVFPGYTANRAVNLINAVCAAPAGIRTSVELPQVISRFG